MTMPSGREVPPPPRDDPEERDPPAREPDDGRPAPEAPGKDGPAVDEPGGSPERERVEPGLEPERKRMQAVRDRSASKGREYVRDRNPSAEGNDPSLTSGPTRERKI